MKEQETNKKIPEEMFSGKGKGTEVQARTMSIETETEETPGFVNEETGEKSTATENTTTVQRTIAVPANAVEFETYCSDMMDGDGSLYAEEAGWVGYYYPNQTYYYTICRVKAEEIGIPEEEFRNGSLLLNFSNESSGMKVFDFQTLDGDNLGSWGETISVADVYNEESGAAEFMIVPSQGCTGSVIIAKTDILLTYNVTLQGISVTTPPMKTKYLVGEIFNPTGMVVTATYSDGTTCEVNGYTYTPSGVLTKDDTKITVSYQGKTTNVGISVLARLTGIEITNSPNKTQYLDGETFDPTGMVVTATYSDGMTNAVTNYTYTTSSLAIGTASVTIFYTEGGVTQTATQAITVYLTEEIYYANTNNDKQTMDIHIPQNTDETYKAGPFPVIITIHGGKWSSGDKNHYDYMTEFITDTCNCVHVNMNYRLTTGVPGGNNITYLEMLDDIESAIGYLQTHAAVYHIDASKIALMGYSAGGHLALLYAYSTANNYTDQANNPIKLVISEAGPTYFAKRNETGEAIEIEVNNYICAIVGIPYRGIVIDAYNNDELDYLFNASPLSYVTTNAPYTILAYGNGIMSNYNNYEGSGGDGLIPYSQAQALETKLSNYAAPYDLYELPNVEHKQFGEGKKVYPNTNVKDQELNETIDAYYAEIARKLEFNS